MNEFIDEFKDFFEDLYDHLFDKQKLAQIDQQTLIARTQNAYHFTERFDGLMKMIFGLSVIISAIISAVWGFAGLGDIVKMLVTSLLGRFALVFIGTSYLINGYWRLINRKSEKPSLKNI